MLSVDVDSFDLGWFVLIVIGSVVVLEDLANVIEVSKSRSGVATTVSATAPRPFSVLRHVERVVRALVPDLRQTPRLSSNHPFSP